MTLDEIPWLHPEDIVIAKLTGISPHCTNCRHWVGTMDARHDDFRGCEYTLINDRLVIGVFKPTCPHFQLKDPA